MKKRMILMILALSVVFGGLFGFTILKGFLIKRFFANYEAPPVSVSSVAAIKKNWEPKINAVGNFVAINGVDVNPEAAGKIVKIHFESGQYVEKNQPLIDLDDSVDQATWKFNKADMALKEISYKRQADLFKRGATSSSSVDETKANLEQAQANLEKIEALIKQKHIVAPFAGRVGIRLVNLGQYITPGQTSIVTLQSLDPLYLEFNLPEQLLKKVHINQGVQFRVEGFSNILFEGKISAINSKVDPNTHNVLVQAMLPNCPAHALKDPLQSNLIHVEQQKDGNEKIISCNSEINQKNRIASFAFIPGMFADIAVDQPSIPNIVVLPSTAISYSLYGNSVFIIEPLKERKKDPQGREIFEVKRIFVKIGEQEGNYTVIESGIQAGQQVVSSGELKLQNGTRVVINNTVKLNTTINTQSLGE